MGAHIGFGCERNNNPKESLRHSSRLSTHSYDRQGYKTNPWTLPFYSEPA